jgi:lysophospholipase L1-like esterase
MKSLILILAGMLFMNVDESKKTKILFFGDSITEIGVQENGYIDLMNKKLKTTGLDSQFELVGSGIGGNKIYDLFFRMEKDVLAKEPDVVVIWIGVNDVWHKSSFGTGSDIGKFEIMYKDIIKRLQQRNIKVYICTPACIGEKTDFSNPQDGDMNAFSNVIRKLSKENKVGLIDFRKTFLDYNFTNNPDNKHSGILTNDGVHLNIQGNQMVADMMWKNVVMP